VGYPEEGDAMTPRSLLAALLLASGFAACSSAQASELGATCDQFSQTPAVQQSAEAKAGEDLTIVLCSNASTGYSWEDAVVGDPTVATVTSQAYEAPAQASLPVVGQAGGEVVKVHAVAPGKTTLTFGYSRPWAGGAKDTWTYELTLTVT
jgi:predicted secreted protein